ncbi:hypothetical protein [Streptomyces cacaoi]|uniref:hypothetical protein n=1 Tax=Streptomyces cacaoi TaxID=1898 RepID=UPI003747DB08
MPTTDSYGQGVQIATRTDAPDPVRFAGELAAGVVPRSVMRFSTAAERNATITKPEPGMIAWLTTEKLFTGYDGTGWVVLAAGSQKWTTISLAAGYAHDGNSNGTAQYRIVNLFGEVSLMFRGGIDITYSSGRPPNNSQINATALPTPARPTTKRTISCACSVQDTTLSSVKLDINPNGTLVLVGIGSTSENPPWVSLNGCFASL